jgi:D-proline reductase (dithiol) PrdB
MPRLDRISESTRKNLLTRPVEINAETPFTVPRVPLANARVAVVTTAGIHLRDDAPFVRYDPTFRTIPGDVRAADLVQTHTSIGFDRTAIIEDVNVSFPIDRLREMQAEGKIGSFGPRFFSFMGAQKDLVTIAATSAPEVASLLRDDGVDVVLLTPS